MFNNLYKINTIKHQPTKWIYQRLNLINEVTLDFTISAISIYPQDECKKLVDSTNTTTADTTLVRADNALQKNIDYDRKHITNARDSKARRENREVNSYSIG